MILHNTTFFQQYQYFQIYATKRILVGEFSEYFAHGGVKMEHIFPSSNRLFFG